MEKFPDHVDAPYLANGATHAQQPGPNGAAALSDRWQPATARDNGHGSAWPAAGRQKSLSDAFRTIRSRNGSMSQNAHEIADALRAPVSPKLVVRQALFPPPGCGGCSLLVVDLVPHVVRLVRPDEYLFQVHPHGL